MSHILSLQFGLGYGYSYGKSPILIQVNAIFPAVMETCLLTVTKLLVWHNLCTSHEMVDLAFISTNVYLTLVYAVLLDYYIDNDLEEFMLYFQQQTKECVLCI